MASQQGCGIAVARIRVWCEGHRDEAFLRRVLACEGFEPRDLTFNVAPRGRGSASSWILEQFQREVLAQAKRCRNQEELFFLVAIDGDAVGLDGRLAQLAARGSDSRIAAFVPCWSVETWLLHLSGNSVDESRSLKARIASELEFREMLRSVTCSAWKAAASQGLPSLQGAHRELGRLLL